MAATTFPGLPAFALPGDNNQRAEKRSEPGATSSPMAATAMQVLIVDDSAVSRKLVEQALFGQPYSLLFARTGKQAVDLYVRHKPSLVIMDCMLPDLNGVEICRRMRSICHDSYTHIIMLTGKSDKASVVAGLQAGADDYLTKPFHEEELIARVAVGLRAVELHRQVQAKNKTLEELALTDAMTGLPNRRAIDEWTARELSGASRHGFSFWVIVADLDRFKHVNDTFGHNAGDEVLKKFSRILKAHTRRSDFCGRLGGEEFLVVMTRATRKDVEKAAERIRAELERTPFTFSGCSMVSTASFGICGFEANQEPSSFSTLLSQADAALYRVKRTGRNRVDIATPSTSEG
jgi:two-component system, cell cycle response regulator